MCPDTRARREGSPGQRSAVSGTQFAVRLVGLATTWMSQFLQSRVLRNLLAQPGILTPDHLVPLICTRIDENESPSVSTAWSALQIGGRFCCFLKASYAWKCFLASMLSAMEQ